MESPRERQERRHRRRRRRRRHRSDGSDDGERRHHKRRRRRRRSRRSRDGEQQDDKSSEDEANAVRVTQLPIRVNQSDLLHFFETKGQFKVVSVKLIKDPLTKCATGVAKVVMKSKEDVAKACERLDNLEIFSGRRNGMGDGERCRVRSFFDPGDAKPVYLSNLRRGIISKDVKMLLSAFGSVTGVKVLVSGENDTAKSNEDNTDNKSEDFTIDENEANESPCVAVGYFKDKANALLCTFSS